MQVGSDLSASTAPKKLFWIAYVTIADKRQTEIVPDVWLMDDYENCMFP